VDTADNADIFRRKLRGKMFAYGPCITFTDAHGHTKPRERLRLCLGRTWNTTPCRSSGPGGTSWRTRGTQTAAIVRVDWKRSGLDQAVSTLVRRRDRGGRPPLISHRGGARRAVAACKYPPEGCPWLRVRGVPHVWRRRWAGILPACERVSSTNVRSNTYEAVRISDAI